MNKPKQCVFGSKKISNRAKVVFVNSVFIVGRRNTTGKILWFLVLNYFLL